MKNSRKIIIIILLFLAFLETSFTGCGGGGSNSFESQSSKAEQYKYTNASALKDGSFSLSSTNSSINVKAEKDYALDHGIILSVRIHICLALGEAEMT